MLSRVRGTATCDPKYYDGIDVDPRWHDFRNFLEDMGERPAGGTIDRIDGSKGYCKENCRWATRKEQVLNRGNTTVYEYGGKQCSIRDIAKHVGIHYNTLNYRITVKGMSLDQAISAVPHKRGIQ